jgi:hypothetical protein
MSAIHLSGNVWIKCLYASVSGSCESMIGYTTDLGKCLYDTELFICIRMSYEGILVWGIPSCGDDAVNRTMVRVVATIVLVSEDACRASSLLYFFRACYSYRQGLGWSDFLQVHNNIFV